MGLGHCIQFIFFLFVFLSSFPELLLVLQCLTVHNYTRAKESQGMKVVKRRTRMMTPINFQIQATIAS